METDLATLMARLATELHDEPDAQATVEAIVALAVEVLHDATSASITIRTRGHHHATLAASSDIAQKADGLQYELDEGPCVASADSADWMRSPHVADDPRWASWGPAAASLGVGSLLSVPLLAHGERIGALNLYAEEAGCFLDDDDVDLALLFTVHAAHALAAARQVEGLSVAVSSRHLIGIAQGILVERFDLTIDQAFAVLRRISSTTNAKLAEVARQIATTRHVPTVGEDHEVDDEDRGGDD
ncbi:GAF and ANTAR domain-containing protein [Nocardioides sp. MH1]|uniref:GAF and ANTAR domain-containing protein n=1 Tax=Nocardioides sp. MH1 TaxID=3242490 RepID=UPI0035203996